MPVTANYADIARCGIADCKVILPRPVQPYSLRRGVGCQGSRSQHVNVRSRTSGELSEVAIENVLGRMEFAVTNAVDYEAVGDARSRCSIFSLAY